MRRQHRVIHLSRLSLIVVALLLSGCAHASKSTTLKVSGDGRSLTRADGSPFFYLGDTAWELFHRLTREEANLYLKNRADKGFNVIQAVVLAELDGLRVPNAYGDLPLIDEDPAQPNERYFEHVDYFVDRAASLGMFVGLLPTWGDKVNKKWGVGPVVFTPENAEAYGAFLGKRYKDKPIIWILGGDRPIESDEQLAIWRAMAKGLRTGDGGRHLITYHPMGGHRSAQWLHGEPWLDFNTFQSGHSERDLPAWEMVDADRALEPAKPTLDSEPCYEDHPVNWKPANGWFDEYDVRKAVYRSLFAGAAGVTYGCHDVWQFWEPGREAISSARTPWKQALDLPAAGQMRFARELLERRRYRSRVPDQSLIVSNSPDAAVLAIATRDPNGRYALIYVPTRTPVTVDLSKLRRDLSAWAFDPKTGAAHKVRAALPDDAVRQRFIPPEDQNVRDWVLVFEAVSN